MLFALISVSMLILFTEIKRYKIWRVEDLLFYMEVRQEQHKTLQKGSGENQNGESYITFFD